MNPDPGGRDAGPLAIVTGAASGIGHALVEALLQRGRAVVALDLRVDAVNPAAHRFAVDVRDEASMAEVAARFGGRAASHVFANAGVGGAPGDAPDLGDDDWEWAWQVNTLGALRTLRLWWPHLSKGRGHAVATLSAAALQSFPGAGPYRASKAALLAALEGLHYRARGTGVSVHAVCPGLVRTRILDQSRYPETLASQATRNAAPSNPFAAHVEQAMRSAETADAFAARVLRMLDAGAPFYCLTHEDTRAWIAGRHRAIEQGAMPFSDFAPPRAAVASAP